LAERRPLREVGEHPFLRALCVRARARAASARAASLLVPPGDDCAVVAPGVEPLALTTDALLEDVHFRRTWLSPAEIGRRAIVVNLSDLAAMGARPAWTLVAVAAPTDLDASYLDELLDGCAAASEEHGALMVGGNLTAAATLGITVTAIGTIAGPCLTRAGARSGDSLIVTGTLGGAAAAVAAWSAGGDPPSALRARFARPEPRVRAGATLAVAGAHAAIDVSDGLLADLGHLCAASGVGAIVERALLPRLPEVATLDASGADFAVSGGEDYELLLACPETLCSNLEALARDAATPLTVIGRCVPASEGIVLRDPDGTTHRSQIGGFDHFAGRA